MHTQTISLKDLAEYDNRTREITFDPKEYHAHVLDLIDITDGKILEPERYCTDFIEVLYLVGWPTVEDYRSFKFWMSLYWPVHSNIEISSESYWASPLLGDVLKHGQARREYIKEIENYWFECDVSRWDERFVGKSSIDAVVDECKQLYILKLNGITVVEDQRDEGLKLLDFLRKKPSIPPNYHRLTQKREREYKKRYKQWFKDKN